MAVALGITCTVLGMEIRELKTDDVERATRLDLQGAEPMSRGADIGNDGHSGQRDGCPMG